MSLVQPLVILIHVSWVCRTLRCLCEICKCEIEGQPLTVEIQDPTVKIQTYLH